MVVEPFFMGMVSGSAFNLSLPLTVIPWLSEPDSVIVSSSPSSLIIVFETVTETVTVKSPTLL